MRKCVIGLVLFLSVTSLFAQTVNVVDLLNAFDANKVGAEAKYGASPVTVKGVIKAISFDMLGNPYVAITETGGDMEFISAQFVFQKTEIGKLIGLAKGNEITLKGKFDSDIMSIIFKGSSIIQYTASLETIKFQRTIDAVSLYALYQTNAVGADAAFRGKEVVIKGLVVGIDKDIISKAPYIKLSGDGSEYVPIGVRCLFPKGESVVSKIEKGSTLTVIGTIGSYLIDIELNNCKLQ